MNFSSLGNLVQNAASQLGGDGNKEHRDRTPQTQEQKWGDVGAAVKVAVEDMQERRSKGEAVDYAKVGDVAKKAAAAYNSEGNKDPINIGKMLASGIMGSGKKEEAPKPGGEHHPQGEQQPEPQHQSQQ